jgi:biopolymer transport protein ExbD
MAFSFEPARKSPITAFSLASLTDIVLLLLVFFLLTSNFIPQNGIEVSLPQSAAESPSEPDYVTISLTREGAYFVGPTEVEATGLLDAVRAVAEAENKTAVVIRADKNATVDQFTRAATVARTLDLRLLLATDQRATEQ